LEDRLSGNGTRKVWFKALTTEKTQRGRPAHKLCSHKQTRSASIRGFSFSISAEALISVNLFRMGYIQRFKNSATSEQLNGSHVYIAFTKATSRGRYSTTNKSFAVEVKGRAFKFNRTRFLLLWP